jgi:hypothetical protein
LKFVIGSFSKFLNFFTIFECFNFDTQNSFSKKNGFFFQKKWINVNRDASQTTTNRRINNTGTIMLNLSKNPVAFKNVSDKNTARERLQRLRNRGSAAPAKVTHQYAGAPIFY